MTALDLGCLACIALCALAAPVDVRAGDAVSDILAANRRAAGAEPARGTFEAEYDYSGEGMAGTTHSIVDRATGAYVERYVIGPTRGASGFDGRRAWMQDLSGAITPQDGGDRPAIAVNEAYRNANRWWRVDRGGARIEFVARERIDDADAHHLRVTPPRGRTFDAWFDAASGHLIRLDEMQQFMRIVTRFADYAPEQGVQVPHTIRVDSGAGPAGLSTLHLRRFAVGPERARRAYAMPPWVVRDASIDGGAAQTTVPIRLANNHIYVDATVDGRGPFPFIVDTGGHTILTPSTVATLGLTSQGASPSAGAGEQTTTNGFVGVRELQVGGMRLTGQTAFTLDFASKETEGFEVGGMIGFEVFRRFVVRIDYGALTLTLIDPARFDARGAGTRVPFRFYDHLPQVDGRFDGRPGRFDIDTGSRSEVDLTTPFVERARLRDDYPQAVLALTGWGVGGAVKSQVVRARSLTLGSVRVDDVVAELSTARAGSFSDANYEGNVGSGFLKRFVATFDYAHQRMYLARRVPPPADAGTFDRSGLWINLQDRGFVIADVAAGSPAAEAGLAVGDIVTAIGGRPAASLALSDARMLLRVPQPGTVVRLDVLHGTESRAVDVTLRDQLARR